MTNFRLYEEQMVIGLKRITWASFFRLVSPFPCLHFHVSIPCVHFSMFPYLHVSMSPCLHVSMSPCLYVSMSSCLHVSISPWFCVSMSMSPCFHVSIFPYFHLSMSPCFRNSANGKRNLRKTATSVYLQQTANGNSKLPFVCCKRNGKRKFVFLGRQTRNGNRW